MKKVVFIVLILSAVITNAQKDEYLEALEKNTVETYNDFLNKYPDSKYENKILGKLLLLEQPAYLDAVNENTVQSLEKFLSDFPESNRKKSILNKIKIARYHELQFSKDLIKLNSYLNMYPNSKYTELVQKRIEYVKASSSSEISELQVYIDNNPHGEYTSEVLMRYEYFKAIPEIEEREQIDDYNELQTIIKAFLSEDTRLSGKELVSKIKISRVADIIWKTYGRLAIYINTIEANKSILSNDINNEHKARIANWYREVLLYYQFANNLILDETDHEITDYGNTILSVLDYGENFFIDYSKINEFESYKLVFEAVFEESKIERRIPNLEDNIELENQFEKFNENITFWYNLEKN